MNAVFKDPDTDWREVLTGEIRAIQSYYPTAHEACKDHWGPWSRYRFGIGPRDARPYLWQLAKPSKFGDFADEEEGKSTAQAQRAQAVQAKAESAPVERFNERLAIELDIRIGRDDFAKVWRRCLRAAYVYRIPEYQWPEHARCGSTGFLMFFDAGLARLQRAFE